MRYRLDNKVMGIKKRSHQSKSATNKQTPWFSTYELLEYLGISKSELDEKLFLLLEGVHYKRENKSEENSQILWRVDLIDELLCLPIPPLEKEAMIKAINNEITCKSI